MTTQEQDQQEKKRQDAEKLLRAGFDAYNDGKYDKAAEAFGDAEIHFRLLGDFKRAGDSRSMVAEVQREQGLLEQAINSYQRTIKHYRQAQRPILEADSSLSLGHVERQLAHLDRAQDAYQSAQQQYRQHHNAQGLGNVALALGHIELQRGNMAYAAEHYQEAIGFFKESNDTTNEADASRSLADIQRMNREFDAALQGYQRTLEIYQSTRDTFGVVDAQTGLGRIYLDQERLDEASDTFAAALNLATATEYELGQADANLGLAEALFLQGNADQALIKAQAALQTYTNQRNGLGSANANRVLGEINLRRGQLSYANSLMERASRTYTATAYRLELAETTAGLGEIQYRRGFLDRAARTFNEARKLAYQSHNVLAESRALLGLGDIYYYQGQSGQARSAYSDARDHVAELGEVVAASRVAEAEIRLARTAIYNGDLHDAETHLANASTAIEKNPLAAQVTPLLLLVRGQFFLVAGDFAQAESLFSDAHNQADAHQEPLWAAEAILHMARARLARGALDAAQATFLEAGREYQTLESTEGDGSTVLGMAQVNIGEQRWDEAIENCDAAILRLTQAGDLLGQADALLTRGLAHRGKDEIEEALLDYEQALKLYHQERRPLGVADTRSARAGILFLRGDLERARDEQAKAITQVEHVMQTLKTPQLWSSFLRQYADLYAQTAITDLRRNRDDEARALLQNFVHIAGSTELAQQLKMYEDNLPSSSEDLSEEEIRTNKDLAKRIAQVRKGL